MANDINRSIKIFIDSTEAGKSIEGLQEHIRKLENELKSLNAEDPKQAAQAKKLKKAIEDSSKTMNTYKQSVAETDRVLKNLSGATYNELISVKNRMGRELKTVARGTADYNVKLEYLKRVSREATLAQKEMRVEVGCQANVWGRAAGWFNKYIGLIGSGLASVTGITMAFQRFRAEQDKLEASSANVKALTGLGDGEVKRLEEAAKRLSTTVTKEGVRIKQSAVEINDSFALIGSQRPELLKNAEALEKVTQDAIYLSIAGKDKLEPAAKALTTVMNQMNLGAENSRRIINAIAAGSQAGAGNIQYITDAFEKSGTTARLMNIELEQHIGLIEAVAPKYSEAAVAGNSLDKVLLKMKEKGIGYKNGVFDLARAIEEIETRFKKGESAASLFGSEHAKMAEILVMNRVDIERYTKAVTDTNKAVEQANINSDINNVKREQARNTLNLLGMELMKTLNPAITLVMDQTVAWAEKLMKLGGWIVKNTGLLVTLGATLTAYTVVVKTLVYWERVRNGEMLTSIKTGKAWTLVTTTMKGAQIALAGAQALLTGNLARARAAWALLNSTMLLNPAVAIGVAIAALTVGIYKLATRTNEAKEAMNSFMESSIKEQTELNKLYGALKRSGEGTEQRTKLINEFNTKYGEYLPNLLSEKSTLEEIKTAYENATKAMRENLAQKALNAKVEEIETDALENKTKELNDIRNELSVLPETLIGDAVSDIVRQVDKGKEKGFELEAVWVGVFSNLKKNYFNNDSDSIPAHLANQLKDYVKEVYKAADKVKAVKKELSPFLPKEKEEPVELPEVTVTAKAKKTVPGKKMKDSEFKAAMDLKLKEMETAHASELALLKKQKLENEQTEQFYNLSVISSDAVYYQKRIDKLQEFLKKAGSKNMQAEINKQIVDVQTKQLEIELKRNKEVISALQDNRDKQLRIVESSYTQQKTILEKAVAEQKITREQADALSLSLETETADKRLFIYQNYQKDILSLESNNGPEKAKAIEDANKAVLDADLKAAQSRANQQKALQDLLKDFKGQFNLTTVGEETELQLKVLEDVYRAKKEMAIKDGLDTTELDAAYEKAKTNILQQEENKRFQIRQQYGFVSLKEQYELERQELQRQYDQGLIDLETFEKAKAQIKVKYLKSSFDYYSGMFSGAITALQDAELANIDAKYDAEIQRAGDNSEEVARLEKEKENKKLAVQKKYAGVQFSIKVSEIIANTAVAIMQAFAQLGPIAGAIAAALMTTTGAAQIAVANSERKKVMNMTVDGSSSSGSGTGTRVATSSDAEYYVGGWSGDGSPYEVAGSIHRKEYVVPSFVMSDPAAMNHVVALEAMRRQRTNANPLPGSVTGYANGGYANGKTDDPDNNTVSIPLQVVKMLISLLSQLNKGPIKAYVVQSELQAEQDRLDESRKIGSKS